MLSRGMGAFNQLQGQGAGMAKDLSKTGDDLMEKVRYVLSVVSRSSYCVHHDHLIQTYSIWSCQVETLIHASQKNTEKV